VTSHPDIIKADALIIGAGPAGLAAAIRCAEHGRNVTIVDDNPEIGGQIWRAGPESVKSRVALEWFRKVKSSNSISILNGRVIVADRLLRRVVVELADGAVAITWGTLILATGARELFLPFPGWTLPGVVGVGGLQALVKSGLSIANKRVVVAGSGPLLLAAAAFLRTQGAVILTIAEQASWRRLFRFGAGLIRFPAKLMQSLALRMSLWRVRYRPGCWVTKAEGDERLRRVHLTNGRMTWTEECDYAAVAFGLWPNTELASLLGCRLDGNATAIDSHGRTSIPDVLCAGEVTGAGGLDLSLAEGEIAGLTACGNLTAANHVFPRRERALHFARSLDYAFRLRPEVKALGDHKTIVCRCEDVTLGCLRETSSWRAAKLHTRCGMGPCQGRICGAALNVLFGWQDPSVRPPLFPSRIGSLLAEDATLERQWQLYEDAMERGDSCSNDALQRRSLDRS
jgi:D-hydroxyproline dehydrogenase subunit alpha